MTKSTHPPSPEEAGAEAQPYRHLPKVISLEDTVGSKRGDSPPEPSGEGNAFIAAAIKAGG